MRRVSRAAVLGALALAFGCDGAADGLELQVEPVCGADGVVRTSLSLETPAELASLRGCREVEGYLIVSAGGIDDLSPLSTLERVEGQLVLGGFPTLAPLAALVSVGGGLTLSFTTVPDLRDLSRLTAIGANSDHRDAGQLQVWDSPNLQDLSGLELVDDVRTVRLIRNPRLRSLEGLRLREGGGLSVVDQPLGDLSALRGVSRIGALELRGVPELANLDDLFALEEASHLLFDAGDLSSVAGLSRLQRLVTLSLRSLDGVSLEVFSEVEVTSRLQISRCRNLELSFASVTDLGPDVGSSWGLEFTDNEGVALAGLENLRSVDGDVLIGDNPDLPHDDAVDFAEGLDVGGSVKIWGNRGSPPPVDPCPFEGDSFCDVPHLCVTDGDCGGGG